MRRTHVLAAITAIAVLGFALPAVGATKSPLSALGLAKKANKTANSAKKTAVSAKKNALLAKTSASSAGKKAQTALDALKKPVAASVSAGTAVTAQNATNAGHANVADNATHANAAGSADNTQVFFKKVDISATAATAPAARAAATEIPLVTKGPLTIYAKCFKDTSGPDVYGEVYVKTSVDRAVLESSGDGLEGGAAVDFLNTDTVETDRTINDESVGTNDSEVGYPHDGQFNAIAADGATFIAGDAGVSVKQGTLAGGNGPFAATDGCIFNGVGHTG
jgi:hypothetical protein